MMLEQALFMAALPFPVVSHYLIEEDSAMAGIRVALVVPSSPSMSWVLLKGIP